MAPARPVWIPFVLLTGLAGLQSSALADEEDPDTEVAKRHFQQGSAAYERRDYAEALREFEAARAVKPVPQLDYNIGRCHDRLERYPEAVAAYKSYLGAEPGAPDAAEIKARVKLLEERLEKRRPPTEKPGTITPIPEKPPVDQPPPAGEVPIYKRGLFWGIVVGVVAVASIAVGLGVALSSGGGSSPPNSLGGDFRVMFP